MNSRVREGSGADERRTGIGRATLGVAAALVLAGFALLVFGSASPPESVWVVCEVPFLPHGPAHRAPGDGEPLPFGVGKAHRSLVLEREAATWRRWLHQCVGRPEPAADAWTYEPTDDAEEIRGATWQRYVRRDRE